MLANRYHETRAHTDTANPPILALNERLGYRRLPGWLAWEALVVELQRRALGDARFDWVEEG